MRVGDQSAGGRLGGECQELGSDFHELGKGSGYLRYEFEFFRARHSYTPLLGNRSKTSMTLLQFAYLMIAASYMIAAVGLWAGH